jgi:hypothetical protein
MKNDATAIRFAALVPTEAAKLGIRGVSGRGAEIPASRDFGRRLPLRSRLLSASI